MNDLRFYFEINLKNLKWIRLNEKNHSLEITTLKGIKNFPESKFFMPFILESKTLLFKKNKKVS